MSRLPANVVIDGVIYGVRATVEEIHVNEGVVNIGDFTVYGCPRLHTVVLPQSLRKIGNSAFYECRALRSINIPPSVTTIGDSAFANNPALRSINISSSVTIGNWAFRRCTALASLAGCDSYDSAAIVQYLRSRTSRILLRYSVLMSIKRVQTDNIDNYRTSTRAQRRELARANPPTEGLNGELAFEYLTFGSGEIWRQVLKFL